MFIQLRLVMIKNIIMFRLINFKVIAYHYRPRVVNLKYLSKRHNEKINDKVQTQKVQQNKGKVHKEKQKDNRPISVSLFNRMIQQQHQELTKQQLQINHLIKIETKAYNLYSLHYKNHLTITPKNMINLLIKVLQLRSINPSQAEQTVKFDKIVQKLIKNINKLTPEDMIRFLFNLKRIRINPSDFIRIQPFVMGVLQEFAEKNKIQQSNNDNIYSSFEVISIESNIKLLFSFNHLRLTTGSYYEPILTNLIKMHLSFFHSQAVSYMNNSPGSKKIRLQFFNKFVELCVLYDMPHEIVFDFVKIINTGKKLYIDRSVFLIDLMGQILKMPSIVQNCRGKKIQQYKQLFFIVQILAQQVEKPGELLKMNHRQIFKLINILNDFTDQQIELLDFQKLKQKIFQNILLFTIQIYEKYWQKSYISLLDKQATQKWIYIAFKDRYEYLVSIILKFHEMFDSKKLPLTDYQLNKLLRICIESFSEVSFSTKAALVLISFQRQFPNTKKMVNILFNIEQHDSENKKLFRLITHFKKQQGVQLYTSLFKYWDQIKLMSRTSFHQYRQGTYIKMLLRLLILKQDTNSYAYLLAKRMLFEPQLMELFMKKFSKVSLENRTLKKKDFDTVQQKQFKNSLNDCIRISDEKRDDDKLNVHYQLKKRIRFKIKRCLYAFKFIIQLLQHKRVLQKSEKCITQTEQFKTMFYHFDQELRCLYFRELLTLKDFQRIEQLVDYLKDKNLFQQTTKLYEIWNWMEQNELAEGIAKTKHHLLQTQYGNQKYSEIKYDNDSEEQQQCSEDKMI